MGGVVVDIDDCIVFVVLCGWCVGGLDVGWVVWVVVNGYWWC